MPAVMLDVGELGSYKEQHAAAWLAAAPPLFPRLGLQLAAHSARLMPLLLRWAEHPAARVRRAALAALLQAVTLTWPRVGAHAAVVWHVLRRVFQQEQSSRWVRVHWVHERLNGTADKRERCAWQALQGPPAAAPEEPSSTACSSQALAVLPASP